MTGCDVQGPEPVCGATFESLVVEAERLHRERQAWGHAGRGTLDRLRVAWRPGGTGGGHDARVGSQPTRNSGDFLRLLANGKQFGLKHINYTYQEGEGGIADALALAELKPGDAIMISTTQGSDPGHVTVIMLLAGVEPLLTASPTATRDIMSGWNLAGGGDTGQ